MRMWWPATYILRSLGPAYYENPKDIVKNVKKILIRTTVKEEFDSRSGCRVGFIEHLMTSWALTCPTLSRGIPCFGEKVMRAWIKIFCKKAYSRVQCDRDTYDHVTWLLEDEMVGRKHCGHRFLTKNNKCSIYENHTKEVWIRCKSGWSWLWGRQERHLGGYWVAFWHQNYKCVFEGDGRASICWLHCLAQL